MHVTRLSYTPSVGRPPPFVNSVRKNQNFASEITKKSKIFGQSVNKEGGFCKPEYKEIALTEALVRATKYSLRFKESTGSMHGKIIRVRSQICHRLHTVSLGETWPFRHLRSINNTCIGAPDGNKLTVEARTVAGTALPIPFVLDLAVGRVGSGRMMTSGIGSTHIYFVGVIATRTTAGSNNVGGLRESCERNSNKHSQAR